MKKRLMSAFLVFTLLLFMSGCEADSENAANSISTMETTGQEETADSSLRESSADITDSFIPGTYTSVVQGHNGEIEIEVVFSESEILSVEIISHSETEEISATARVRIPEEIVTYQSLAVDTVSGSTVSSNAILNAVADCIDQAGGDVDVYRQKSVLKEDGESEEKTVDILVIGAGTSGTTAALAAAEGGAKVLVIEATSSPGGAGALTGGTTYAPGNILVEATESEVQAQIQADLDYLMDYTHYNADKYFLRTFLSESGNTVNWLIEHGMGFVTSFNDYTTKYENRGTQQFLDLYDHMIENYDLEILYETHGDSLLVDEFGKVIGAIATKADGGQLTVNCEKIILATGGFGGNEEMLEMYVPSYVGDATNEGFSADGSGHLMAWEIGAGIGTIGIQVHNNSLPRIALEAGVSTRSGSEIDDVYSLANTPLLWVNQQGSRFVNEDIMYSATLSGNVIYKVGKVYVVFDQATVDQAMGEESLGLKAWRGDATVPLYNLTDQLEAGIDIGYIFKGGTIEELAENAGLDALTLENTVERYNTFVDTGVDEDYEKDSECLVYSIDEGPYYAIQLAPRYLGTLGGLDINNNYQVLNTEGDVIEGLYATGFNATSWMGTTYVDFSGITMSFALTSGRLAGEHAVSSFQN